MAALLALGSIVSQVDRTVVNLRIEPIKAQFALNDTQFGLLQGVALGIFYVLACGPIGRLSDRYPRKLRLPSAHVFALQFCQALEFDPGDDS